MKTNILLLLLPPALLLSCNGSGKIDVANEDLVPSKIYFVAKDVGSDRVKEISFLDLGDAYGSFDLALYKSGIETEPATAKIAVLSDEEFADYNTRLEKNFIMLNPSAYSIDKTEFSFSGRYDDINKSARIEFDLAALEDAGDNAVLPLKISECSVSTSGELSVIILNPKIVDVVISFAHGGTINDFNGDGSLGADINLTLEAILGLDDNRWNIEVELTVDEDFVDNYNLENHSFYTLLTNDRYTLETGKTIVSGTVSAIYNLKITKDDITPGQYMLPIRLKSSSLFTIDADALYLVRIDILSGHRLDRTGWEAPTALCNSYEPAEAGTGNALFPRGYPEAVLDGDLASYWHSQWKPDKVPPPVYIVIDMKGQHIIEQVEMIQRQQYSSCKDVELYLGADAGELAGMESMNDPVDMQNHLAATDTWRQIASFQMKAVIDPQVFKTTRTSGRYLMVLITSSHRSDAVTNLSEVYPFGEKL